MQNQVTVVGLGAMGATIADLYLKRGSRVTVWNRTPDKAGALVERGAVLASGLASALAASPFAVMCVSNDAAVSEALGLPGVTAAIADRTLVQLTTISPETAREGERWSRAHRARFLAGAIQAAPSQMGQADTPILVSGERATWEAHREHLAPLGGGFVYLGDDAGAAATMDLATLSWVYGGMLGFLHGAMIAQAQGIDVGAYGAIVRSISPSFGAFFEHEGRVIESGDFAITESPLRISIDATTRLLDASRRARINADFPAYLVGLFDRAARANLGGEEVAALIKVMRA